MGTTDEAFGLGEVCQPHEMCQFSKYQYGLCDPSSRRLNVWRSGREADHLSPSSTDIKNEWNQGCSDYPKM
jgi:hypothetical protein